MYYNARCYLPELRRFISPDTVVPGAGNPQNLNRYSYVRNNPVNYVDPSGHALAITSDADSLDLRRTMAVHRRPPLNSPAGTAPAAGAATAPIDITAAIAGRSGRQPSAAVPQTPAVSVGSQLYTAALEGMTDPALFAAGIGSLWPNTQMAWTIATHPGEVKALPGGRTAYGLAAGYLGLEAIGAASGIAGGYGLASEAALYATARITTALAVAACADADCTNEAQSVNRFVNMMDEAEAFRYQQYWNARAPVQSEPYSIYRRYQAGTDIIRQVTTYDLFGNRYRQYDLIDSRWGEHVHQFFYGYGMSEVWFSRPSGYREASHILLTVLDQ